MLIGAGVPVYFAAEAVDMRKPIDGLTAWVQGSLAVSPLSGSLFASFNRVQGKVKPLWWDQHGFWLVCKHLERVRLRLPADHQLTLTELVLVLEGIDLSVRRFKTVDCQRIARNRRTKSGATHFG